MLGCCGTRAGFHLGVTRVSPSGAARRKIYIPVGILLPFLETREGPFHRSDSPIFKFG